MNSYSLDEIKASFYADDLKDWQNPELKSLDWGELDYLAWPHAKGGSYYICVETESGLVGSIFEMNAGAGDYKNQCSFCFGTNQTSGVKAAMVATGSNPRRKFGYHVCADLRCSQRVRGLEDAVFPYETIGMGRRIERLQAKLINFAKGIRSAR